MTSETASFWANVAVVTFTVLAAFAGVFALYLSGKATAEKDAALDRFKAESAATISSADARAAEAFAQAATANERTKALELATEEQRERAAKAEKELLALQLFIREPRRLNLEEAKKILANNPKGHASILFAADEEAKTFASELSKTLSDAGWTVDIEKGTMQSDRSPSLEGVPLKGLVLEKGLPTGEPIPDVVHSGDTLHKVLLASEGFWHWQIRVQPSRYVPVGEVRVIVGTKF